MNGSGWQLTEVGDGDDEAAIADASLAENFTSHDPRPLRLREEEVKVVLQVGVRVRVAVGQVARVVGARKLLRDRWHAGTATHDARRQEVALLGLRGIANKGRWTKSTSIPEISARQITGLSISQWHGLQLYIRWLFQLKN